MERQIKEEISGEQQERQDSKEPVGASVPVSDCS